MHDAKYAHGVLHPKNIMLNRNGDIFFTGYGFESLRKYLSLTTDYSNLSIYTGV